MIIKSISLKDFECYRGEHEDNKFQFSEGINLIIGDNGSGKSKLFDGFYWVLYDQVFNTDSREFVHTKNYKEKLISDNAKNSCEVGKYISAEVTLVVIDSRDVEFRITRIYRAKKVDDRSWESEASSKLFIDEYKVTRWQSVPSEKHQSILDRVIPGHLKPYMWFQGEQVDSLMDFKDKSALMQAINMLSDISDYDELIEISKAGYEKSVKSFNSATRKLSKDQSESESISRKIERLEKEIDKLEASREQNQKQRNIAQSHIDTLINQVDDAEKKANLKEKREQLVQRIEKASNILGSRLEGLTKKIFSESWLLKSAKPVFSEYSEKYSSYYERHQEIVNKNKTEFYELPIDVPQPIHIDKMLVEEKCFVCGRQARKGTAEYEHISKLLRRKDDEQEEVFENDCSQLFQKLYNHSLGYVQLIKNIDRNISNEFQEISDIRSEIQKNREQLRSIDEQFDELIAEDRSEDIVKEFKTHQRKIETYTDLIASESKAIESHEIDLKKLRLAESKLIGGEIEKSVVASKDVFENLYKVALSVRDDVFTDLVESLEESANEIFQEMVSENNSITGKLKLKMLSKDACIPEIVDRDGFVMSGSNDSNIILVKLSLIMAVVTSRAKWSENYCLVSDAPTSKMSKKYSQGFYKALGHNFSQSIVMTYDFLTVEERQALKQFNLGSLFKIESSYPGGDRENRSDLSIKVSEVSL